MIELSVYIGSVYLKKQGNASSVLNDKLICESFGADHSFLFDD